jgi:hypothetical protein
MKTEKKIHGVVTTSDGMGFEGILTKRKPKYIRHLIAEEFRNFSIPAVRASLV